MERKIILNSKEISILIHSQTQNEVKFNFAGYEYSVKLLSQNADELTLEINGRIKQTRVNSFESKGLMQIFSGDLEGYLELPGKAQGNKQAHKGEGSLVSPMPGKIFKVLKAEGDKIKIGESILILEAMKMEHTIKSSKDGLLTKIFFKEGEQVTGGAELCEIE